MSFRWPLLAFLLLLNLFAWRAMRHSVNVWVQRPARRKQILVGLTLLVCLLNIPLLIFFVREVYPVLMGMPAPMLKLFFYPAAAWVVTLLAFFLIAGPVSLMWNVGSGIVMLYRRLAPHAASRLEGAPASAPSPPSGLSRRQFLAGSAGLLVPAIYSVAAYGTFRELDDLEISPEVAIPISRLPSALEGMTIVHLSDLHVGPYIREAELRYLVSLVNGLRPDLVFLTGDMIDRDISTLPELVRGLTGIKSSVGSFAVLGNHDISSDRYSYTRQHRGGVQIAEGMESIGFRVLRNSVEYVGSGRDRLALLGLDWLTADASGRSFFRYHQGRTVQELGRMAQAVEPETPKILLAHHPDTFSDVHRYGIGLTLAGHTHGGGQIVLGNMNGKPLGIANLRFRYVSGLYQEQGNSLYVNRGIGYLGVPIRINCPPEISRFRLVRRAST